MAGFSSEWQNKRKAEGSKDSTVTKRGQLIERSLVILTIRVRKKLSDFGQLKEVNWRIMVQEPGAGRRKFTVWGKMMTAALTPKLFTKT